MSDLDGSSGRQVCTRAGDPLRIGMGTGTAWKWIKVGKQNTEHGSLIEELVEQLETSLNLGFRHIDTAEVYNTHAEVGAAIRRSNIERSKVFIASKFNGGVEDMPRTSKDPKSALEKILAELQTDYVDIFLIHQPFFDDRNEELTLEEAWRQMIMMKKEGKARYIGVSNFSKKHLNKIMSLCQPEDYPSVNQIEFHPYLQNQSPDIVDFCQRHHILVEAYAPLAPLFRIEKDNKEVIDHPIRKTLHKLSAKYKVTDAQLLLRYCLQKNIIPITTTTKVSRLKEIMEVYNFRIETQDLDEIDYVGSTFHFRAFFHGFYEND